LLTNEAKVDVGIDQPQQMVLGNLIFQTEVVEQRFRAGVATIMSFSPSPMAIHNSMVTICCYAALIARESMFQIIRFIGQVKFQAPSTLQPDS
jgi:hypothetical protein